MKIIKEKILYKPEQEVEENPEMIKEREEIQTKQTGHRRQFQ